MMRLEDQSAPWVSDRGEGVETAPETLGITRSPESRYLDSLPPN